MAYQPKSYRKFVATAATAAIVASAVAPAANAASVSDFTDVPTKYQDAVKYLLDNGITEGTTETTFGTSDNVKRGDAAIWLVRALDLDTTGAAPSGFSDTGRYDAYVSVLKDKGILSGKTATTFEPSAQLTRGEMAKILANAYGLEADVEVPFTDLGPNFGPYIKALYAFEITTGKTETTFGTGENITRGDLAIFLKKAAEVVKEVKLDSASAVGVKKLEVKFNSAVDTAKATVTVKKGTSNIGVAKITFAENKKSAVVELNSKLTEGKYTVNVAGLTKDPLSAEVTVENEKVGSVELLSDNAIMTDNNTVEVGYQILNQYGEKLEGASNPVATSTKGTATAAAGKVTIDATSDFKAGEKLTLTLIDTASAKSVSKELTVSSEAFTSDVVFAGIIDNAGKAVSELNQKDNASNFFLEVSAKDQYGRDVTDAAKLNKDLLVTINSNAVVSLVDKDAGAPDVQPFAVVTDSNSKKHTAIELDVADASGEAIVTVVSKSTGKAVSYKVTVAERVKADVVTIGAAEASLIAGGDKVLFPVEATNNKGAAITKVADLGASKVEVSGVAGSTVKYVEKDGKLYAEVTVGDVANVGTIVLTATSETSKVDTEVAQVRATAVPKAIIGLKSNVETAVYKGEILTLDWDKFVIQDQYGRELKLTEDATKWSVKATEVTGNGQITVTTSDTKGAGIVLSGTAKGTESITFQLVDSADKVVANSSTDVTFRTVEGSEFTSYGVEDITSTYADGAADPVVKDIYDKVVKVYGVTADGKKVYLPNTSFNVVTNSSNLVASKVGTEWVLDAVNTGLAANTTKAVTVTVTVNENGKEVTKEVSISNVAPTVASVEYRNTDNKAVTTLDFTGATAFEEVNVEPSLVTIDTYGVEDNTVEVDRITFSNIKEKDTTKSNITVANNGLDGASIAGLEAGDTFDATIYVDGKSVKLAVTVK